MFSLAAQLRALLRRALLALIHVNDEWNREQFVDPKSPTLQLLIEQQEAANEQELGVMICWAYSRDRVVEQRERRHESEFLKRKRLAKARLDKANGRRSPLRMVV